MGSLMTRIIAVFTTALAVALLFKLRRAEKRRKRDLNALGIGAMKIMPTVDKLEPRRQWPCTTSFDPYLDDLACPRMLALSA